MPLVRVISTLGLSLAMISPSALAGLESCDVIDLDNPYSNDTYGVVEYNGYYWDGGHYHFRRRPVTGGSWQAFNGATLQQFVEPMIVDGDRLIVGGLFGSIGGVPASCVASIEGDTVVPMGPGLAGEVSSLIVHNGTIIAGGEFTSDGAGNSMLHVAQWDQEALHWVRMDEGLDGVPTGYSGAVWDMAIFKDELYVTGRFTTSDRTQLNGIARWDEQMRAWMPLGSGIPGMSNGNVGSALGVYEDKLYLSGWFQQISGVNAPWMATWDGDTWSAVDPVLDRHVLDMEVYGGQLHCTGPGCFEINGQEYDVARFDGHTWRGVGSPNVNFVWDMAPTQDGSGLMMGGPFNSFNGHFTGTIFVWDCMVDTELPCDPTGDFEVGVDDVLLMLAQFGACAGCEGDLDGDGDVDVNDLLELLGIWGPC